MGRVIRIHKVEIATAALPHRLDCGWLCVLVEMKLWCLLGGRSRGVLEPQMFSLDWRGWSTQMQLFTKTHQITLKIGFIVCRLFLQGTGEQKYIK